MNERYDFKNGGYVRENTSLLPCTGIGCTPVVRLTERVAWLRWLSVGQIGILVYIVAKLSGF